MGGMLRSRLGLEDATAAASTSTHATTKCGFSAKPTPAATPAEPRLAARERRAARRHQNVGQRQQQREVFSLTEVLLDERQADERHDGDDRKETVGPRAADDPQAAANRPQCE